MHTIIRWAVLWSVALLFVASPATATDWYVRADWVGTESGTAAEPYNTLSEAQTACSSGDTIYVYGTGTTPTYGALVYRNVGGTNRAWSSSGKNITITSWPGTGRARISGATGVLASQLTSAGGSLYYFEIADATTVQAVTGGYYSQTKPTTPCIGAYGGYLTEVNTGVPATDIATITGANGWTIDTSTTPDRVYVDATSAYTAAGGYTDYLIEYIVDNNTIAISMSGGTGCVVSDIDFDRIDPRETDDANGIAVQFSNSTNGLISGLTVQDIGDKAVAVVNTSGAEVNTGNVVQNCTFSGSGSRTPDTVGPVYYCASTSDITGARIVNCTSYVRGLYKYDFTPLPPRPTSIWGGATYVSSPMRGFSMHVGTAPTTNECADIEWYLCNVQIDPQFFLGTSTAVYPGMAYDWYIIGTTVLSGSPWQVSNYPARLVLCTTDNGMGAIWSQYSNVAYDRCTLYHDAGKSNLIYRYNADNRGVLAFTSAASASVATHVLMSGCDVMNTNSATSTNASGFLSFGPTTANITSNLHLWAVNTTFRQRAVPNASQPMVFLVPYANTTSPYDAGNSGMSFNRCAFVHTSNAGLDDLAEYSRAYLVFGPSDPSVSAIRGQFNFTSCLYWGFPATGTGSGGFASNTASTVQTATINDAAEWIRIMDPTGVNATPQFIDVAGTADPAPSSPLRTARSGPVERTARDIRYRIGLGIGPYQYTDLFPPTRPFLNR